MADLWSSWTLFQQLMICIAGVFTFIFIIQITLTVSGFEVSDAIDGVMSAGDSSGLFTFRNMVSFMSCMGWVGFILYGYGFSELLSLSIGIMVGFVVMALNFSVMRIVSKLSENNTFDISDIVGSRAKVYTPISPERSGLIQVKYGGGLHEISAKSEMPIASHTHVVVVKIIGPDLVMVEPI